MTQKKNVLGFTVALVILLGFPAIAMYYMNKGVRYRKDLFAQLDDYGSISVFSKALAGKKKETKGKVVVAFFLEKSGQSEDVFSKIFGQFKNRDDVFFITKGQTSVSDSTQVWPLDAKHQIEFTQSLVAVSPHFSNEAYLIDRAGHLRKKYDLSNSNEVELLVRQIALFLPPKKTPKAELKRELEK